MRSKYYCIFGIYKIKDVINIENQEDTKQYRHVLFKLNA